MLIAFGGFDKDLHAADWPVTPGVTGWFRKPGESTVRT